LQNSTPVSADSLEVLFNLDTQSREKASQWVKEYGLC
jgi:1-deoxy-D-xylulose-5-phosphate reductoisomerase